MSLLFTAKQIGGIEIGNRFVHSATYEAMAEESGKVSERMIERYKELAEGGVGLIIPGFIYVHPLGKSTNQQAGIHSDEMIPRLKEMVNAVHIVGGKIAFQLTHAGRHTSKEAIGETPMGPSSKGEIQYSWSSPER